jgi:hypothetical protein
MHFATVEDFCHYISAGIGPFYLQNLSKVLNYRALWSCLTPEALSREAQRAFHDTRFTAYSQVQDRSHRS